MDNALLVSIITNANAILSLAAAVTDIIWMKIPNIIPLTLLILFGVVCAYFRIDIYVVMWHLLAGLLVFAIGFVFFSFRWVGGGDVKFAIAIAAWIGFNQLLLVYFFVSSLFGGVLTIFILILRRWSVIQMLPPWRWLERLRDPKVGIPYGVALAAGVFMTYIQTPIWPILSKYVGV